MMATGMRALDALLNLQRAMEASRRSAWLGGATTTGYGAFPPVNVFRQGEDFVLVAELPGVDKSQLDIQVKGGQVRIKGVKTVGLAEGASVHRARAALGRFRPGAGDPGGNRWRAGRGLLSKTACSRCVCRAPRPTGRGPSRSVTRRETMTTRQEIEVQQKEAVAAAQEATRHYVPATDIHETEDALAISMEVPGVGKEGVEVALENDTLKVSCQVDFSSYEDLEPIYTEYDVGHYSRSFSLSSKIDQGGISARVEDGVLFLPKTKEAVPRRIAVE